jgi:hypothetical protein
VRGCGCDPNLNKALEEQARPQQHAQRLQQPRKSQRTGNTSRARRKQINPVLVKGAGIDAVMHAQQMTARAAQAPERDNALQLCVGVA